MTNTGSKLENPIKLWQLAAKHGTRVLVAQNETFEVGDHDFTKFSLIPSVSFVINIPETIEGSWYEGKSM